MFLCTLKHTVIQSIMKIVKFSFQQSSFNATGLKTIYTLLQLKMFWHVRREGVWRKPI